MNKISLFFALALSLLFHGCRIGPKYSYPVTDVPVEWKYESSEICYTPCEDCWWHIFDDNVLNCLEDQALANNKDLYVAYERVVEARGQAGEAASPLFPNIDLRPSYFNEGILYQLYGLQPIQFKREHRRRDTFPLVVNYEIDLWGKIRQAYESAVYNAEAVEQELQNFMLILTSDVAYSYYTIRMIDSGTQFLEETLKILKKATKINLERFQAKINDKSDALRAELEYNETLDEYDRLVQQRGLEENRLALLLGVPASEFKVSFNPLYSLPPPIPPSLPSEVITQRADIAEAERIRASEHAMIGVAYASFFPSISLTGAIGFSSPEFHDFMKWKSRLWQIGLQSLQPLFDGGLRCSNLAIAISKFRQADAEYQNQVLVALQEVEDALLKLETLKLEYETMDISVKEAKDLNRIATNRYGSGITFYLDVIDAERQKLYTESNRILLLGERYFATIELIKALGGSW
jgi:multidrug efflux system outer membrane protein